MIIKCFLNIFFKTKKKTVDQFFVLKKEHPKKSPQKGWIFTGLRPTARISAQYVFL